VEIKYLGELAVGFVRPAWLRKAETRKINLLRGLLNFVTTLHTSSVHFVGQKVYNTNKLAAKDVYYASYLLPTDGAVLHQLGTLPTTAQVSTF